MFAINLQAVSYLVLHFDLKLYNHDIIAIKTSFYVIQIKYYNIMLK